MLEKNKSILYREWHDSLTDAMCKKIIQGGLGEEADGRELMVKKERSLHIHTIYVGFRKSEGKEILWADTNCPHFIIYDSLQIEFQKGEYASTGLIKKIDLEKFIENIDWFGMYSCLSSILKDEGILA